MQVFIPEQVAYSKPDLERHMRTGDLTGPMAESGFKGHPQCRCCHALKSLELMDQHFVREHVTACSGLDSLLSTATTCFAV